MTIPTVESAAEPPTEAELHDPVWQDANLEKITSITILRGEVRVRWNTDLPACQAKDDAISNLGKLIDEYTYTYPDRFRINMFANTAMDYCAAAKSYAGPPPPPPPPPPVKER